jgi:hypothetical protein
MPFNLFSHQSVLCKVTFYFKVVGVSKMSAGNYMQERCNHVIHVTRQNKGEKMQTPGVQKGGIIFASVSGFEYPLSLLPVCYHGTGRIILASTVTSRAQACQITVTGGLPLHLAISNKLSGFYAEVQ